MRRIISLTLSAVIAVSTVVNITACRDTEVFEGEENAESESEIMALMPEVEEAEPLNEDKVSVIVEIPEKEPAGIEKETEEPEVSEEIIEEEPESVEYKAPEQEPEEVVEEESAVSEPEVSEKQKPEPEVAEGSHIVEYTVDGISKTVYTIANTDVRLGPSAEFGDVGTLMSGMEVAVTGVCSETGWYRCSYMGTDVYFDSEYTADAVTQTQPAIESEKPEETEKAVSVLNVPIEYQKYAFGGFPLYNYDWHSGLYLGRMRIPSVDIDIALYNTNAQYAIDAYDSAAFSYMFDVNGFSDPLNDTIYCADHRYQAFSTLDKCTVGCEMYIDGTDGKTYLYVCDRIDLNGYNTGWGLNDSRGYSMNLTGGIWCYTCHDDSDEYVYMVHFAPVTV